MVPDERGNMIIRENIKYYRKMKNMTQDELAEAADLSTSYISQIETGKKDVGRDGIMRIAQALDISPSMLFQNQDNICELNISSNLIQELEECTVYEIGIIYQVLISLKRALRDNCK